MNHDAAVLLVPDLVKGALSERDRLQVEEHAAGCGECRDQILACRDIAAILGREAAVATAGAHPPSDAIVTFALHREDLPGEQAAAIRTHLASCASCRSEVETVRRSEAAIGDAGEAALESDAVGRADSPAFKADLALVRGRFPRWLKHGRFAALAAAAIVLIVMGMPLYLTQQRSHEQAVRIEALDRQMEALRTENEGLRQSAREAATPAEPSSGWGPYAINLLRSAPRGTGTTPRFTVAAAEPVLFLTFEPILPVDEAAAPAALRLELRDAMGKEVLSFESEAKKLRSIVEASDGVLPLRLPASALAPGRYELVESAAGGEVLLRLAFEIARP